MHEYANRPVGNPLELDFVSTTRALSSIGRVVQIEKMRVSAMLLSLEMMRNEIKSFSLSMVKNSEIGMGEALKINMEEMVEAEMNLCQNLSLRADAEISRAQSQVSVVSPPSLQYKSEYNDALSQTTCDILSLCSDE